MPERNDLNNHVFISTREMIIRPPEIEKKSKLMGRFVITKKICDGSVCSIYVARDELTGSKVALKVSNMNCGPSIARLVHEKRIYDSLEDLSHVTKCFGLHQAEIGHVPIMFLALEYASSGSLQDWMTKYKDDHEYRLKYGLATFKKCAKSAASLNRQGYVCNDLSPANFVKIQKEWKVTDLGLTCSTRKQLTCNVGPDMWGTPLHMSPEAFDVRSFDELDARSDSYLMAIILYQILSPDADPPFYAESFNKLRQLHCHRRVPSLTCVDKYLDETMVKGLSKDPVDRYEDIDEMLCDIESKCKQVSPQERSNTHFEVGQAEYQKGNYATATVRLKKVTPDGEGHGDALALLEDIKLRHGQVCCLIPDILHQVEKMQNLSGAQDMYHQCNQIYPNHPALRPVEAKLNVSSKKAERLLDSFICAVKASDLIDVDRCFEKLDEVDSDSEQTCRARRVKNTVENALDQMNSQLEIADESHDYSQSLSIRNEFHQIINDLAEGPEIKHLVERMNLPLRSLK